MVLERPLYDVLFLYIDFLYSSLHATRCTYSVLVLV